MREETAIFLIGIALVFITSVITMVWIYTRQHFKKKKKCKERYKLYRRSRREKAMKERLELFDCYLLALGVK